MSETPLDRIPIFSALSDDELNGLRRIAVARRFDASETLFWQEDPSDALYIILSGFVKAYSTTPDGKEKILTLLGPGEFVGEIGLLDGRPRSATVETLVETNMLVIHRSTFYDHVLQHSEVLWKIQIAICGKLRQLSTQMLDASYLDVPKRLLNTFLLLAQKHGESSGEGHRIIRLPHRELANMIGSNRETVTRLMKKLEQQGLIQVTARSIEIPSLKALQEVVDQL